MSRKKISKETIEEARKQWDIDYSRKDRSEREEMITRSALTFKLYDHSDHSSWLKKWENRMGTSKKLLFAFWDLVAMSISMANTTAVSPFLAFGLAMALSTSRGYFPALAAWILGTLLYLGGLADKGSALMFVSCIAAMAIVRPLFEREKDWTKKENIFSDSSHISTAIHLSFIWIALLHNHWWMTMALCVLTVLPIAIMTRSSDVKVFVKYIFVPLFAIAFELVFAWGAGYIMTWYGCKIPIGAGIAFVIPLIIWNPERKFILDNDYSFSITRPEGIVPIAAFMMGAGMNVKTISDAIGPLLITCSGFCAGILFSVAHDDVKKKGIFPCIILPLLFPLIPLLFAWDSVSFCFSSLVFALKSFPLKSLVVVALSCLVSKLALEHLWGKLNRVPLVNYDYLGKNNDYAKKLKYCKKHMPHRVYCYQMEAQGLVEMKRSDLLLARMLIFLTSLPVLAIGANYILGIKPGLWMVLSALPFLHDRKSYYWEIYDHDIIKE